MSQVRNAWSIAFGTSILGSCIVLPLEPVAQEPDGGPSPWSGASACSASATSIKGAAPNAALVRACVLLRSCDLSFDHSVSECIRRNYPGTLSRWQRECLLDPQLQSCEDVARCGRAVEQLAGEECPEGRQGSHCRDDIVVTCLVTSSQVRLQRLMACTGTCKVPSGEESNPNANFCVLTGELAQLCSRQLAPQAGCAGDVAYNCRNGVAHGYDCKRSGGTCRLTTLSTRPDGGQEGVCDAPATECKGVQRTTSACEGDRLVRCEAPFLPPDYFERREYPCGWIGHRCVSSTDGKADCVPEGCTLREVEDCKESCNGSVLELCPKLQIDCKDYGFSKCLPGDAGSPNVRLPVSCSN